MLPGLPAAIVVKFQGQFSIWRYLPKGLCYRNCVILQTNRARCILNKEILDLVNVESVSGARSGGVSLNFTRRLPRVSES